MPKVDLEKTLITIVVAIAVVILVAVGWNVLKIKYGVGVPENVRIGVVLPFSGDSREYGEALQNALNLALEDINAREEWRSQPILLEYKDGECSPEVARNVAREFVREQVDIIIGGFCSDETVGIANGVKGSKVFVVTPASSSQRISHLGDLVFRMAISNTSSGRVLAQEAHTRGYESPAIIHEETEYASTLADAFVEGLTAVGGTPGKVVTYATGEIDLSQQVSELADALAESDKKAVMIAAQSATTLQRVLAAFANQGFEDVRYFTDVFGGADRLREVGSSVIGTVYVEPYFDLGSTKTQEFLRDYQKTNTEFPDLQPIYLASTYDSLQLVAEAIEHLGRENARPAAIANYFYELDGWNGVSNANLKFDKNGDANYELALREIE